MTAEELAAIRSRVGSTPDNSTIEDLWDRLGSVEAVALDILRQRLADFSASPASLNVVGDFSQSTDANIRVLAGQVAELETLVNTGTTGMSSARLVRSGPDR